MLRVETETELGTEVLADILDLIETATRIEGHRPVGEHKYAHLAEGAKGWVGVLAYEEQPGEARRLVGYAHTRWNAPGARPRLAVEVVVHPERYGTEIAPRLLAEVNRVLGLAGGGVLYLWVHRVEDAADTTAARLGYRVQRELAFMTRPLTAPPGPADWPEGVTLRPYQGPVDHPELLRVNNAAFEGHPENGGWEMGELERRLGMDWFDPAGLLLAWEGDRLLGFHWTKWHGHDSDEAPVHDPVGEVYILAVDPAAHGKGLGRRLLEEGLRHLHSRGCRLAVLYVDRSSTPAMRLYQSAGFALESLEVCYEREVPPIPAPADDLLRPA